MSMKPSNPLHVCFLPMPAPGHMIPMVDMARQFTRNGVKATIITTQLNAIQFSKTIEAERGRGTAIRIRLVKFPCKEGGLPEGCENLASTTTTDMSLKFFKALDLLEEPVKQLLEEEHPDCVIATPFFHWAHDISAKLEIPRLVFNGLGYFPLCLYHALVQHKPHENVASESEEFLVLGLPDAIKISRQHLSYHLTDNTENPMTQVIRNVINATNTSYGVILNSFYELEPAYADYYRDVVGRKTWHIGPLSLCNNDSEDKAQRGRESSIGKHECLNWLDSKKPKSVVYICFGSMSIFSAAQLREIAIGMEASGQPFIWVVREKPNDNGSVEWLPEGFERRMDERGLIIEGWAPQVLILDHEAIGGFVTHCGWNSLLEGVSAGVPMVTWPLSAEQFLNEKLVTEVLKIGTPVGAQKWSERTDDRDVIKGESIKKAVLQLMAGEEAARMRSQANVLRNMAKRAIEEGGSSNADLNSLLEEVRMYCP